MQAPARVPSYERGSIPFPVHVAHRRIAQQAPRPGRSDCASAESAGYRRTLRRHPARAAAKTGCHSATTCEFVENETTTVSGLSTAYRRRITATGCDRSERSRKVIASARDGELGLGRRLEMTLEPVEQRRLIGMNDAARAGDLDELDLVDFPRRALGQRAFGRPRGVAVHALLRARVVDVAEIDQRSGDVEPGLFERLAARGRFERPRRDRARLSGSPTARAGCSCRPGGRAAPRCWRRRSGRAPCPRTISRAARTSTRTVQDADAALQVLGVAFQRSRMLDGVPSCRNEHRSSASSGSRGWWSRVSRTRSSRRPTCWRMRRRTCSRATCRPSC